MMTNDIIASDIAIGAKQRVSDLPFFMKASLKLCIPAEFLARDFLSMSSPYIREGAFTAIVTCIAGYSRINSSGW
jgi:hypothetical protein